MIPIVTGQAIGGYQVGRFLGRGAFSLVFAAKDTAGREFALKLGDESGGGRYLERYPEVTSQREPGRISPDETPAEALFLDPHDGARAEVLNAHEVDGLLRGEAELLKKADGRGVVRLHGVVESEGRPVLVLDLVPGSTLRERIRSLEGVKLRWILDVCRTLEQQSACGAWSCHGDVKPENILVTEDERVILIDPVPHSERDDEVVTTPYYNPFLRRDAKGDAQSLAILLYELVCGALPFDRVPWELAGTDGSAYSDEERTFQRALYLSFPRPREMNPRAPQEIERSIYRALCDVEYGLRDLRLDLEDFLLRQ